MKDDHERFLTSATHRFMVAAHRVRVKRRGRTFCYVALPKWYRELRMQRA